MHTGGDSGMQAVMRYRRMPSAHQLAVRRAKGQQAEAERNLVMGRAGPVNPKAGAIGADLSKTAAQAAAGPGRAETEGGLPQWDETQRQRACDRLDYSILQLADTLMLLLDL